MIDTRLVLLEGPPGSGKTTMSKKLFDRISVSNKCLVQESTHPHPIAENDFVDDMDVWQVRTLRNLKELFAETDSDQKLWIMEFAWFQNTIGLMLLNDCRRDQIMEVCREIEHTIKYLSPVLIRYTANNAATFVRETYDLRDDGWSEKMDGLIENWQYGKKRNLTGFDGFLDFYGEYLSIANALYDELEIDRISIDVAKRDWPEVEKQTYEFLQV